MAHIDFRKNADEEVDVHVEPPHTLHWVVPEREDLEAELNAISHLAPDFSRDLIHRVVQRIEDL